MSAPDMRTLAIALSHACPASSAQPQGEASTDVLTPVLANPSQLRPLLHLDDLVGDQSVCLTMHGVGSFLAWSLDQTEGFARSRIEPVLVIRDSVVLLNLHVLFVRTLDRLGSQAIDLVMNIHIQRHREPPH